ncbi:MAG TPA: hypothetical protein VLH56_16800 [Dissulfurispiraceae bacterium]|nr:hypothetical protein [Dissulfurispiraceae bacterium]
MNTSVEIKTSTESYQLYYDNRAFRRLEEHTARDFAQLSHTNLSELTAMLWVGLLRYQPKATMETADGILDDLGYAAVMDIVVKAIEDSPPFRKRKDAD